VSPAKTPKRIDPAELIADYLRAFARANPESKPPRITYERGWFLFWEGEREDGRCRWGALIGMRARLLERAGF
jgi:hypothetical protein